MICWGCGWLGLDKGIFFFAGWDFWARLGGMMKLALALLALGTLVPASAQGSGQTANQATPTSQAKAPAALAAPVMPSDPNALMLLAAQVNGLGAADMKPWHLKANYQTFDADGKPKDQGVFEEWWAGPEKYKISYTSTGFNQVQYRDGEKAWITGDAGWASLPEEMVSRYLLHPLPDAEEIGKKKYVATDEKMGKATLKCIGPLPLPKLIREPAVADCFDEDSPAIRLDVSSGALFVIFNDTALVNSHYLAEQVAVKNSNLAIVNLHVTTIEGLSKTEDSVFTPPASATPAPPERVKPAVMAGRKIGGADIRYPLEAKDQHIQGLVMLEGTITQAGTIGNLQIISGPKALQRAAFDAVKTWKYKPYLLNGQPIEVRTEIHVVFTLGALRMEF